VNSAAPILELADGAEVVRRAWRDGLRPDPRISNVEWAEKHRILPGKTAAEGGPFRVSRTPYVREIMEKLNPLGVAVVIEAEHLCMKMRGVEKQNSQIITSTLLGAFRSRQETRNEFMNLIRQKS